MLRNPLTTINLRLRYLVIIRVINSHSWLESVMFEIKRFHYDFSVNRQLASRALLPWLSVVAAIAIGPVFIYMGYAMGLVYGAAGLAYLCSRYLSNPSSCIANRSE